MKSIAIHEVTLVRDSSVKLEIDGRDIGKVAKFIRDFIGPSDREHLIAVALNIRQRVVSVSEISVGSVDSSIAHPREIFKPAILSNASYIIIAHNHPSDEVDPSDMDLRLTARIEQAGNILGITMIDHLVIGSERFYSIKSTSSRPYPMELPKQEEVSPS